MLTEISRGSHVYCAHTMSATTMARHLKDGVYLQITFMKYDQYYPWILGVNAPNTLAHILSVKLNEKEHYTENLH